MNNFIFESNPIILEDMSLISAATLNWNYLAGKTIIVTGGDGFIGSYLVKALLFATAQRNLEIKVICVARKPLSKLTRLKSYLDNPNLVFFQHDISQRLPTNFPSANVIIHAASQASPKYYGVDPVGTISANTIGTMQLLEHAQKTGSSRFLFFSSGEIYGEYSKNETLIPESNYGSIDPLNIRSCYAESKRMGEAMCSAWGHQFNLSIVIVRPFHTYGPGLALDDGRVFADFVADVVAKRDIRIHSDGSAKRAFCYISDAVIGILTVLISGEKGEAYNVANIDSEISISDLATLLLNIYSNYGIKIKYGSPPLSREYLGSTISTRTPSIDKIRQLGWNPKIGLEEGFIRTIQSYSYY
jgi:UDP-glucuronate decarboxylase